MKPSFISNQDNAPKVTTRYIEFYPDGLKPIISLRDGAELLKQLENDPYYKHLNLVPKNGEELTYLTGDFRI